MSHTTTPEYAELRAINDGDDASERTHAHAHAAAADVVWMHDKALLWQLPFAAALAVPGGAAGGGVDGDDNEGGVDEAARQQRREANAARLRAMAAAKRVARVEALDARLSALVRHEWWRACRDARHSVASASNARRPTTS
jgi:hypothetical protein